MLFQEVFFYYERIIEGEQTSQNSYAMYAFPNFLFFFYTEFLTKQVVGYLCWKICVGILHLYVHDNV